ncbi:hypothetical protein ES703_27511 [subsurface metagenome]
MVFGTPRFGLKVKMKFSWIPYAPQIGRLLKVILPNNMTVPILQGKLRGKKWIIGSGVIEMALGSYEYEKRTLIERRVQNSSVFYDIGAHVGFYTLLASQLVGPDGKVIAFEPVCRNLNYLRRHLVINHCANVVVIGAAVSDKNGIFPFSEGSNSSMGYLSDEGNLTVNTVSIDELVMNGEIAAPDYMKIDVEGAELLVLKGAKATLSNCNVEMFLAIHNPKIHIDCRNFLTSLDYKVKPVVGDDLYNAREIFAYKE